MGVSRASSTSPFGTHEEDKGGAGGCPLLAHLPCSGPTVYLKEREEGLGFFVGGKASSSYPLLRDRCEARRFGRLLQYLALGKEEKESNHKRP